MIAFRLVAVLPLLIPWDLLPAAEPQRQPATVLKIVDGDTIDAMVKGKKERIRMLRVNCPESVHPDRKRNISAGKAASEYVRKRLARKTIQLEAEGEERDRYGRLLRYVWLDGKNFCLELVRAGHSPFYTPYGHGRYAEQFRKAEKEARDAKRGIWGDPELSRKYLRLKSKWGMAAKRSEAEEDSSDGKRNRP